MRKGLILLIAISILLVSAIFLVVPADTILDDFQVNTEFPGHPPQDNPYSVANWQMTRIYTTFLSQHDGANWDVALAQHKYNLRPVGQTTYLNVREGTYNCLRPKLVIRSTGVGAAWIEARNPNRILFRSLDGDGNPTCPPVRVEDDFSNVPRDSLSIAALYDGFLLVWHDGRDSSKIWAQKVNLSGQSIGPNFPIQPDSAGSILGLEAQNHPDGRVLVSWVTNGQYSRGRWLDSLGNFMGEVFEMAEGWTDQFIAQSMVRYANDELGALYQYSATQIGEPWDWLKYSYITYLDSNGMQQSPLMQLGAWSGWSEMAGYDEFYSSFPDLLLTASGDYSFINSFWYNGYAMGGVTWNGSYNQLFSSILDTTVFPSGLVSSYDLCALDNLTFLHTFDLAFIGLRKIEINTLDSSAQIVWVGEPNFYASQRNPSIAAHQNGNFRITYENYLCQFPYINSRHFSSSGTPSGPDTLISLATNFDHIFTAGARMKSKGQEEALIIWPFGNNILGTQFTDNNWSGSILEFGISPSGYWPIGLPDFDLNSSDHVSLIWLMGYGFYGYPEYNIYMQSFQQLSMPFLPSVAISPLFPYANWFQFDVSLRDDGRFTVVWADIWQAWDHGIFKRSGLDYNSLTGQTQFVDVVAGSPSIEKSSLGYWLAWQFQYQVKIYQLDSDGNFVDSIKIISSDDAIGAGNPAIAVSSSDNFAVCWQDARNDSGDIYCRQFNPDGSFFGNEYRVNSDPVGVMQKEPAIAFGPEDRLYFTWTDFRNPGGQGDIYCKVIEWADALDAPVYQPPLPRAFALFPPSPNPFNAITAISYQLPANSFVSLRVYDTTGRLVSILADGQQAAGSHQVLFDGADLASGIYIARLQAGDFVGVQKMVLLK